MNIHHHGAPYGFHLDGYSDKKKVYKADKYSIAYRAETSVYLDVVIVLLQELGSLTPHYIRDFLT
jgi:hypothetical protein